MHLFIRDKLEKLRLAALIIRPIQEMMIHHNLNQQ